MKNTTLPPQARKKPAAAPNAAQLSSSSNLGQRIDALSRAAVTRAQAVHPSPLARDVAHLSSLFTDEREDREPVYLRTPPLRRAYLGFFVPQYAAKIALLLQQIEQERRYTGETFLPAAPRVLDLGAGPLTGLLSALLWRGQLGPSHAVDSAVKAMSDGLLLMNDVAPDAASQVTLSTAHLMGPRSLWWSSDEKNPHKAYNKGPYDLIVLAHVINELGDPRRALEQRRNLVEGLLDVLAPNGKILIVEPATRVHSRSLQELRDMLVNADAVDADLLEISEDDDAELQAAFRPQGKKNAPAHTPSDIRPVTMMPEGRTAKLRVVAPCTGCERCPLLHRTVDWCHSDMHWELPYVLAHVAKAAKLRKEVLKMSYLLLERRADTADKTETSTNTQTAYRLVGGPMVGDDQMVRRYACTDAGLVTLRSKRANFAYAQTSNMPSPLHRPMRGTLWTSLPDSVELDIADRRTGDRRGAGQFTQQPSQQSSQQSRQQPQPSSPKPPYKSQGKFEQQARYASVDKFGRSNKAPHEKSHEKSHDKTPDRPREIVFRASLSDFDDFGDFDDVDDFDDFDADVDGFDRPDAARKPARRDEKPRSVGKHPHKKPHGSAGGKPNKKPQAKPHAKPSRPS